MKKLIVPVLSWWLLFGLVSAAFPAVRAWEMDKQHSNIYFSARHIFAEVRGRFDDFTAKVLFDPARLEESLLEMVIKVKSIDTANGKRDKHLRSADFFDASTYPAITFRSHSITDAGDGLYRAAGKLTVKGKESDLTLPLRFSEIRDHPTVQGQQVAGLNGTVKVDLRSLNIGDGKLVAMGLLGAEVEVLVTLELLSPK